MFNVAGTVTIGPNHLLLKGVPIVAPAGGAAGAERGGEELIRSLDLRVEKGEHTLITGPKCVGCLLRPMPRLAHELQWSRQEFDRANHRAALASMGGSARKAGAWRGRSVPSSSEAVLEHWLAQGSVSGDRSDPADVVRVI